MKFYKFVPIKIRSLLKKYLREMLCSENDCFPNGPISASFSSAYIKNLKVMPNREFLLSSLPKGGVVAEIGVADGNFSQKIVSIVRPDKLVLIDAWGSSRYPDSMRDQVESKFSSEISLGRVDLYQAESLRAVSLFPDSYFDWIYIDTDHSYLTTLEELCQYASKVKPSGFILGHDFIQGNWNGRVRYGVIEAVSQFCIKHNWELSFLTMDFDEMPSFGLTRRSAS